MMSNTVSMRWVLFWGALVCLAIYLTPKLDSSGPARNPSVPVAKERIQAAFAEARNRAVGSHSEVKVLFADDGRSVTLGELTYELPAGIRVDRESSMFSDGTAVLFDELGRVVGDVRLVLDDGSQQTTMRATSLRSETAP